jgi:hypothetical protein
VVADLFGGVGEVELDGPAATRLEVDEQRPVPGGEQVARLGLAVQQLLGGPTAGDRPLPALERVAEQVPVGVRESRRALPARNELLGLGDAVGEVRRGDSEPPHAGMQPCERVQSAGATSRAATGA